ncbi:MAG: CoA pyrophosphatase [Betaproteobacteria bacterium]|nr:CoA pyrophosphatase [Betaproteobacteria bacterium]
MSYSGFTVPLIESLRAALANTPEEAGFAVGEGVTDLSGGSASRTEWIQAAVLLAVVTRPEAPTLLFTRRTEHLRDHAGQVSFPGGRIEETDRNATHTALRETKEETGLSPESVNVIGYLPRHYTGTGFCITPVVGLVSPPLSLQPDPFEVAEIFEAPLSFLLNPGNRRQSWIHWQGRLRRYFAFSYEEHFIWGATAGILVTLGDRIENG